MNRLSCPTEGSAAFETAITAEHAKVTYVLATLHLSQYKHVMMDLAENETGRRRLTFDCFNQVIHDFPSTLRSHNFAELKKPMHLVQEAILPNLFRHFAKAPFVKKYNEMKEEYRTSNKPFGLLFPRKGLQQGLVIHNGYQGDFVPAGASCFVWQPTRDDTPLIVQDLLMFLWQINETWKPQANYGDLQ